MTAISHEVVSMYEEAGLSVEEIAQDTPFAIESIKATLLQFSKVYRNQVEQERAANSKSKASELITDTELEEMMEVVKDIARYQKTENPAVSLKAACRIIDEKENRLSAIKEVRGANYNIVMYNQQLLANRRAKEKVLELQEIT